MIASQLHSLFPAGNREEAILHFQLETMLYRYGWLLNLRFGKLSENTEHGHSGINGLADAEMLFPEVRKSDIYHIG
jgi:hypothetical protein